MGRAETTVILEDPEEPEALDARIQEDEKAAKAEAERTRPGLTIFTVGSRLDSGATGYAVAWQKGQSWVGSETNMGYNQEAYDVECAALARALEMAARRQTVSEKLPSSLTPKPPSGERHRKTRAQARCTQSRQGSTLWRYGVPDRILPSRYGGAYSQGHSQK